MPIANLIHVNLVFGANGRPVCQKPFEHGHLVAAFVAFGAGAVAAGGFLHGHFEWAMGVRP